MNEELFGELCEQEEYGLFGKEHERQQCFLHSVSVSLPEYELNFCEKCYQMTNHLNGICQKCKGNER